MEVIKSIEEVFGHKPGDSDWMSHDGFKIVTTDQTIFMGISNEQSCCEDWGYFITNDDMTDFIGARLLDVKIVDTCLNKDKAPDLYEGACMYVDIETDKGTLQFTAYNEHNGYYGHSAVVVSKQLNEVEYL